MYKNTIFIKIPIKLHIIVQQIFNTSILFDERIMYLSNFFLVISILIIIVIPIRL